MRFEVTDVESNLQLALLMTGRVEGKGSLNLMFSANGFCHILSQKANIG
jgi:hypothetical protein